ncbi:MAG: T9SS type A sorting domain-containing protein [Ignavibacteria bacterium]|nr:T9SS type A sorting domain-containing protein [Ignavibacteria bacterium]
MKKVIFQILIFFAGAASIFSQPVSLQWARTFGANSAYFEEIQKVVLDTAGNIYAAGTGGEGANPPYILTLKYSPAGVLLWSRQSDNKGLGTDIVLDRQGNAYVTGSKIGAQNYLVVVKYNSAGVQQWEYSYPSSSSSFTNTGVKLALSDDESSVFITGSIMNSSFSVDVITIKLNSGGVMLWAYEYLSTNKEYACDIKVKKDFSGKERVFVMARSEYFDPPLRTDVMVLTFNDSSAVLQPIDTTTLTAPNYSYSAGGIVIGENMEVFISGNFKNYNLSVPGDVFTSKYDRFGRLIWTKTFSYAYYISRGTTSPDVFQKDKNGNLIAGCCKDTTGIMDFCILKYDTAGSLLWKSTYARNDIDNLNAISVDDSNNVFASGAMRQPNGRDYTGIVKYDKNGNLKWFQSYASGSFSNVSYSLAIDKNRNVYSGGYAQLENGADCLLLKYSQTTGIREQISGAAKYFSMSQNYPNPFNPNTVISYQLSVAGFVTLSVFDINGRLVKELVNEKQSAGSHEVNFSGEGLPSGVYYYSLTADGVTIDTKKAILLK